MVLEEQGLLQQFCLSQSAGPFVDAADGCVNCLAIRHSGARDRANPESRDYQLEIPGLCQVAHPGMTCCQTKRRDGIAPVASQHSCSLVQALRAPVCKAKKSLAGDPSEVTALGVRHWITSFRC